MRRSYEQQLGPGTTAPLFPPRRRGRYADHSRRELHSSRLEGPTRMSTPILTAAELDRLRRYNTPTISNAIELFDVRPRHLGFLPHTIRCLLPRPGAHRRLRGDFAHAGREARTDRIQQPTCWATICAMWPRCQAPRSPSAGTWTSRAGLGAQFGEVTATIHQKLGCVGHITSGCPRDLDEVEALGFQLFGLNPCVSHAYVRLVDFGTPVMIGGVEIRSGDLLHADKHGVCLIPHEVAPRLADACVEVESRERPLLESCRSAQLLARGVHQAQGRHARDP